MEALLEGGAGERGVLVGGRGPGWPSGGWVPLEGRWVGSRLEAQLEGGIGWRGPSLSEEF